MILEVPLQIGDPCDQSRPKVQFGIVGAGGCGTTSLRKNFEQRLGGMRPDSNTKIDGLNKWFPGPGLFGDEC